MQRDSKGRFVKGNKEGRKIGSNGGITAVEAQLLGAEARKRNRALADVIRAELTKAAPGTDLTKMEYLAAKAISNHAQGEMTFKDLRDLQHLLGEDKQILNLEGDGIRIVVENAEQAAKLGEIEKLG
jgi:hypothetical protein